MSSFSEEEKPRCCSISWFKYKRDSLRAFWKRPTTYPMFLLSTICLFLNADQNLIAPNLTQIANEFNFTAIERDEVLGGELNLGFFVIGGIVALLVGYLTDKVNRRNLFVFCIFFGELSNFCTIFVYDYWSLFVTRAFTGISIGASLPLTMSMVSDMFDETVRGKAISFISGMFALGIGIGQIIAGTAGPANALGWRAPFAIVASPTFILAPLFLFTTKEPKRGGQEHAVKLLRAEKNGTIESDEAPDLGEKLDWKSFKVLMKNRTAILAFCQGIPGSFPWGVMLVYFQDFLVQDLGPLIEGGITTEQSTVTILAFGVGSGLGIVLGGFFHDRLWKMKPQYVPLFMASTTAIGALPIYAIVNSPAQSYLIYSAITIPAGILASMTGTAIRAVIMNVTSPHVRGTAFAIFTLSDDLGKGLGPFWVGKIIKGFNGNRIAAFNIALAGWFICSMLLFAMTFTIAKDYTKQKEAVQKAVDRTRGVRDEENNDNVGTSSNSNETPQPSTQLEKPLSSSSEIKPEVDSLSATIFSSDNPKFETV